MRTNSNLATAVRFKFTAAVAAVLGFVFQHQLGADVPPPVIQQFQVAADGSVLLRWDAAEGSAYQVQTTTDPVEGPWTPLDYLVASSNSVIWQANGQEGTARFYQVSTEAFAFGSVEPSIVSTGVVTDVYITGQGFGSDDELRLIGPGGPLALTNRIVLSSTLMMFTAGPGFTPDVPGDYGFELTSGSSGKIARTYSYQWSLVSAPSGSRALYEPPEEPPASPEGSYLSKKGYDYYPHRNGMGNLGSNPLYQESNRTSRRDVRSTVGWRKGGGASVGKPNPGSLNRGASVGKPNLGKSDRGASVGKPNPGITDSEDDSFDADKHQVHLPQYSGTAVMLHSGEVQIEEADMVIPGRGLDFVWARTYRSRAGHHLSFDDRWAHSYDISVSQTSDGVAVADGTGRSDVYHLDANGVYSRPEFFNEGTFNNGAFTLTFPDTGQWIFNPFDGSATSGKLAQIVDRNGNTVSLSYDGSGQLAQIVDDLGRTNTVAYNASGQLASITDFSGRAVTYQYYGGGEAGGSPGDLKSVTSPAVTGTPNGNDFPAGKTTTYTYSTGFPNDAENHLLLTITDAKGEIVTRHVYQHNQTDLEFLRCRSVQYGTNDPVYFTYAAQVASPANHYATLKVTVRDAMGNVSECLYNSRNLPVDLREYTGRAPVAGPVTDSSNRPVNPVRATDPAFFETQWTWNQDSLCVQETEPLGNSVRCVYERDYNPNASPRKKGDLRAVHLADLSGDGLPDLVVRYEYDPRFGSPGIRTVDGGGIHLPHVNVTSSGSRVWPSGWNGTIKGNPRVWSNESARTWSNKSARGIVASKPVGTGGSTGRARGIVAGKPNVGAGSAGRARGIVAQKPGGSAGQARGIIANKPGGSAGRARGIIANKPSGMGGSAGRLAIPTSLWHGPLRRTGSFIVSETDPRGLSAGKEIKVETAASGGSYRQNIEELHADFAIAITDPLGHVTTASYDSKGNRVTMQFQWSITPDPRLDFTYNSHGQFTTITNAPDGNGYRSVDTISYYSDGAQAGYVQSIAIDESGVHLTSSYEYDDRGNVTRCVDPRGNDSLYTYNALDQVMQVLSAQLGNAVGSYRIATQFSYDANDNLTRVDLDNRDQDGLLDPVNPVVSTQFNYDFLNRMTSCWRDKDGHLVLRCTSFSYDANDNLVLFRSGEAVNGNNTNKVVQYVYDERNRIFQEKSVPDIITQRLVNQFDYDLNGNLTRYVEDVESAVGSPITTFAYDGFDRPVSVTDPLGNVGTCAYDANGNVISSRQLDAGSVRLAETTYTYDELDRCVKSVDWFYSIPTQLPIGNGNSTTTYAYALNGDCLSVTDDNGHKTSYAYDTAGRLATVTDPKQNTVVYAPDAGGNVLSITQTDISDLGGAPQIFVTTMQYDSLERCTTVADNVGNTTRYAYDSRDNLVRQTDANGHLSGWSYDGLDRCTLVVADLDGDGLLDFARTILTTYDDNDCVLSTTDANTNTTSYAYDARNRCVLTTGADGTHSSFSYDARGNCVQQVDPNGSVITCTYDLDDRCVRKDIIPNGAAEVAATTTFETFAYDGCSRLVQASNDVSQLDFTYDSLGNLEKSKQDCLMTARTFDGVGNCLSMTYPSGRVVTYTYDGSDQVTSVSTSDGGLPPITLATYAYDGPGDSAQSARKDGQFTAADYNYKEHARVARIIRGNGIGTRINWDGQLNTPNTTGDLGWQQVARINHAAIGGKPVIDQRRLAYDGNGNKTLRAQTAPFFTGGDMTTNIWDYTPLSQLSRAINTKGTGSTMRTYDLDAQGNRQSVTENGSTEFYTRLNTIPPGDFQMDRYTATPFGINQYDANGNMVQVTTPVSQTLYAYDYADRLVAVYDSSSTPPTQVASYAYDPLGRRLSKTTYPGGLPPEMTYYVHRGLDMDLDYDGSLIETRSGGPAGGVSHTYCSGQAETGYGRFGRPAINTALAVFDAKGVLEYYFHSDDLGNVLALTDTNGQVLERYEYDDFGAPQFLTSDGTPMVDSGGLPVTSSPRGNRFLFHGMEWDPETGLYFRKKFSSAQAQMETKPRNRCVYVNPKTGRGLSRSEDCCLSCRQWPQPGYFSFGNNNPWTSD